MNRITYFLLPLFDISKNEKTLHIIDTQGFFCLLQYLSTAFLYPQGLEPWTPTLRVSCLLRGQKLRFRP